MDQLFDENVLVVQISKRQQLIDKYTKLLTSLPNFDPNNVDQILTNYYNSESIYEFILDIMLYSYPNIERFHNENSDNHTILINSIKNDMLQNSDKYEKMFKSIFK